MFPLPYLGLQKRHFSIVFVTLIVFAGIAFLGIVPHAHAATTYYIATTGSDANSGTSSATAFATFHHALAQMLGCDKLIVENGIYYDSANLNTSNLAGNVGGTGCYTTIEAATTWGATIDSSQVTPTPNSTVFISEPYIQVIGIKAASNPNDTGTGGGGSPWAVNSTNHVKLQQTAGYNAPCGFNGVNWNVDVYAVGPSSSYVLIEDSHAWGCGRYKFLSYQSDHVIFRRDVARHDYAGGSTPTKVSSQAADFTTYDSQYTLLQNDIGIDSGLVNGETGNMYGGLWSEHNDGAIDNPIEMEGSIMLNVQSDGALQDQKESGVHTFVNDALWNDEGGLGIGPELTGSTIAGTSVTAVTLGTSYATITLSSPAFIETGNTVVFSGLTGNAAVLNGPTRYTVLTGANDVTPVSTFTVNHSSASAGGPYSTGGSFTWASGVTLPTTNVSHMTIGNISGTAQDSSHMWGVDVQGGAPFSYYTSQSVTNSIFETANSYGVADEVNSNYNYFYKNAANFGSTYYQGYTPTAGPNDVLNINPQLKYITEVEPGTPGYGTASDGGNIGATILDEIGVTGTLYGDPGYDTTTNIPLWPFPNQDVIKSDMASFSMINPITGNLISGARGFAAPGTGLYGGPITLTSYIWEALGNSCPSNICPTASSTPAISFFSSSPSSVAVNGTSSLNWNVLNASSVVITPGGYATSTLIGSTSTPALATSTIYTLTATNANGTSISQAMVTVNNTTSSVPIDLTASAVSQSEIDLTWIASTTNTSIAGYDIYRNGTLIATTSQLSYNDTNLSASTAYSYYLDAYDATGNIFTTSGVVFAITQTASTGGGGSSSGGGSSGSSSGGGGGGGSSGVSSGGGGGGGGDFSSGSGSTVTTSPPASSGSSSLAALQAELLLLMQELKTLIAQAIAQGIALPQSALTLAGVSSTSTQNYQFTRTLSLSSSGNDVRELQLFLMANDTGPQGKKLVSATGYFGTTTKDALAEYQALVGITPASGVLGPKTIAYLNGGGAAQTKTSVVPTTTVSPQTSATSTPASATTASSLLSFGDTGSSVTTLQGILKGQGYLTQGTYTEGTFDAATEQAVKTFQCIEGIACSATTPGYGLVGSKTRAALGM